MKSGLDAKLLFLQVDMLNQTKTLGSLVFRLSNISIVWCKKNGYTFDIVYSSKCVSVFLHQTLPKYWAFLLHFSFGLEDFKFWYAFNARFLDWVGINVALTYLLLHNWFDFPYSSIKEFCHKCQGGQWSAKSWQRSLWMPPNSIPTSIFGQIRISKDLIWLVSAVN